MMLRKFGHILFVSALMLAGACFTACNDSVIDDGTDGEPVQMFASIASRNAVESRFVSGIADYEKNKFEKDDKINVDAWHFSGSNGERTSEPNFFIDQEMTYDGSSSWIYSPVKYWPNVVDEKLAVCAYHVCPTITGKYTVEENSVKTEYPHCTINKDSQKGYSMTFRYCGLLDDVVVAPLTEVSRSQLEEGKIPLTFYHILAQVKIRVRYIPTEGSPAEDNYLTIKRVIFNYYSEAGTFTGFADVDGVPTAQWNDVKLNGNSLFDASEVRIDANQDFKYLDGMEFCQIPFTSPTYDADYAKDMRYSTLEFFVTYDNENYPPLSLGDPDQDGNTDYINALSYKKEVGFTLQAGKTTTFDVTFNGKDIVVDVSVDGIPDWSGAGGTINAGF